MNCTLCNKKITGYGHNASPLAEGKACDACHSGHIVPTRFALAGATSPLDVAGIVAGEIHLIKTLYAEVAA